MPCLGVIQVLRNAGEGGWVYAQALRSITRGWGGGGLCQRYVTFFFIANTAWFTVMSDADAVKIIWLPFPIICSCA